MAFTPRRSSQPEEFVSPKQREALAIRKAELIAEMNERLDQMPDSYEKQQLIAKRDHSIARFPIFPIDLSVWMVAYFEDWMRDYDRAAGT